MTQLIRGNAPAKQISDALSCCGVIRIFSLSEDSLTSPAYSTFYQCKDQNDIRDEVDNTPYDKFEELRIGFQIFPSQYSRRFVYPGMFGKGRPGFIAAYASLTTISNHSCDLPLVCKNFTAARNLLANWIIRTHAPYPLLGIIVDRKRNRVYVSNFSTPSQPWNREQEFNRVINRLNSCDT